MISVPQCARIETLVQHQNSIGDGVHSGATNYTRTRCSPNYINFLFPSASFPLTDQITNFFLCSLPKRRIVSWVPALSCVLCQTFPMIRADKAMGRHWTLTTSNIDSTVHR